MKGGLLGTFSLRKIFMKNLSIKQSNPIFSRIKESFEGILSIFNDITELDNEISLPSELRDSIQKLDAKAKDFEVNGITNPKQPEKQKHTKVTKTRIEPISINKNIDSLESSSRMNITTSDIELDR